MDDAQAQVKRIERGSKALGDHTGLLYSHLPYAYGIETGRHRKSGKLARKAGGAHYIRRAIDEVMGDADRDISEGLDKVTAPGAWIMRRLARWSQRLAKENAPHGPPIRQKRRPGRKTYRLRHKIRYSVRKKGA